MLGTNIGNALKKCPFSSVRTEKLFGDKPSRAIVGGQLLAMEPRYSDPFKVRPRVLRAILY
jgi:hypothetical protein